MKESSAAKPVRPRVSKPAAAPRAKRASRPAESPIPREEIALLAHSYWEARGHHGGSPDEDWQRAEQELKAQRTAAAKKRTTAAANKK